MDVPVELEDCDGKQIPFAMPIILEAESMITTVAVTILSPITFIAIGVLISAYCKKNSVFGEGTGITMAALMLLAVPVLVLTGALCFVMPVLLSVILLRLTAFLLGFAVTTFCMDRANSS